MFPQRVCALTKTFKNLFAPFCIQKSKSRTKLKMTQKGEFIIFFFFQVT